MTIISTKIRKKYGLYCQNVMIFEFSNGILDKNSMGIVIDIVELKFATMVVLSSLQHLFNFWLRLLITMECVSFNHAKKYH